MYVTNFCPHITPGEVQELHEATNSTPSIVVVTPEEGGTDNSPSLPTVCLDSSSPRLNMNALPRQFVQTARPPISHFS